ncbi:MAG: hypothetical protein ACOYK6_01600 [Chthoniobacterales bacterium]
MNSAFENLHLSDVNGVQQPLTVHTIRQVFELSKRLDKETWVQMRSLLYEKMEVIKKMMTDIEKYQFHKAYKANKQRMPGVEKELYKKGFDPDQIELVISSMGKRIGELEKFIQTIEQSIASNGHYDFASESPDFLTPEKQLESLERDYKRLLAIQRGVPEGVIYKTSSEETKNSPYPPCEDFPELTFYRKLLGDLYKKRCSTWDAYYNSTQKTSTRLVISNDPKKSLPKCDGIIGLSNPDGNCAINSALQLLKVAVRCVKNSAPPEEWDRLSKNIKEEMPFLYKFCEEASFTQFECQELHKEVAHVLHEDAWYSLLSGLGISKEQLEHGHFFGSFTEYVLPVLSHKIKLFPLCYTKQEVINDDERKNTTPHALQTLYLKSSRGSSKDIQKLFDQQFTNQRCLLTNPTPTLCIRFDDDHGKVNQVLQSITLPDAHGNSIVYEPQGISCSFDKHAFSFVKEQGRWYLANDSVIFPIPNTDETDIETCFSHYGRTIVYGRKQEKEKVMTPTETGNGSVPNNNQAAQIKSTTTSSKNFFLMRVVKSTQTQD